jgi:hypothetical protein
VARVVIITQTHDEFARRDYLLRTLATHWSAAGHQVLTVAGRGSWPDADVAVMHVDLSVIPNAYTEAAKRYPVVVNGAARDVRKRTVSQHLVSLGDGWTGPVIIKTDLNCGGIPERRLQLIGYKTGQWDDVSPAEIACTTEPYPVLSGAEKVPWQVWQHEGLVVERFLPERDERGYWMRAWVFFGDRERCTRYLGAKPVVKASEVLAREPAPVPDALREERKRLGFDYGKFDFVIHNHEVILFDANRTPFGPPPPLTPEMEASNADLARGLDSWLGA